VKIQYPAIIIPVALLSIAVCAIAASPGPDGTSSGANVSGVVKFHGSALPPARIQMVGDPNCAKGHTGPVYSEEMVTDSSGDLANVVVYVSDGLGDRTFDPPTQPAMLEQKGCLYEPHVVAMRAGQTLKVTNADSTTHNIHPSPVNNREWNKSQAPGVSIEETFARQEVSVPVKCNVHPWMKSYVAVLKNPYFAVSGKDGSFEIKDLPPGTYTLQAWHEKLGTRAQQITVGANETKKLEFDFK
jgi:plastocyanin